MRKTKSNMRRLAYSLLVLAMAAMGWQNAFAILPESLANPNVGNPTNYVCDPSDLLSAPTEKYVNSRMAEVRASTSAEMALAVVKSLDGIPIQDYAYRLFKHWGLGKQDKNNGVLLLMAIDDRECFIQVGSGAEGVLPDIACANIIRRNIVPAMKDGNLNQAVSSGINEIAEVLADPEAAAEIRSAEKDGMGSRLKGIDKEVIWEFLLLVASFAFLFSLIMFVIDLATTRKRDNYRRAMTWRSHLATYWWAALVSMGTSLPIALLAYWLYKRSRNVREICDTCGALMNKLSEDEDNAFLSPSQDFEEKLGTVDYDVWLCPDCGTVARFPYVEKQLKYQECPSCHTIAMNLVMDKVVVPPTTRRQGHGEKLYQCQYCKHKKREGYVIPKKSDDAALLGALAAGAAIGSRGSGGGGGFTGGFGGGSTSGGGAGGHW